MQSQVYSSFETLKAVVGQEVGISDWFTVTQPLVDAFAAVTGDRQWIHCDAERARLESPYNNTIAHGFFTLALVSQLHEQAVRIECCRRIINYGLNRVRFPAAVVVGSRIRLRSTLNALEEQADACQATWHVTVEIEGQAKPALAAEWLVRYYR